ncbi:MAG: hypothetical protein PUC32_03365, partial [Oscillospiraceae bacterium]|nr:hypothetical protein [Oscillospiraceae bacterium]
MQKFVKRTFSLLSLFLCCVMLSTLVPMTDWAADPATVNKIYATYDNGEPTDFVVAENQPEGKEQFGLFIDGGEYTMQNTDNDMFIIANNAHVITDNYTVGEFRLSGNSSINMGSYTISSAYDSESGTGFQAFDTTNWNQDAESILAFYDSETYTGNDKEGVERV